MVVNRVDNFYSAMPPPSYDLQEVFGRGRGNRNNTRATQLNRGHQENRRLKWRLHNPPDIIVGGGRVEFDLSYCHW